MLKLGDGIFDKICKNQDEIKRIMVTPVPDVDVNYLSDQGSLVVIVVAKSHNHRFPDTIHKESCNRCFFQENFIMRESPTLRGPRVFQLASCSSVEILLHLYKAQPRRLISCVKTLILRNYFASMGFTGKSEVRGHCRKIFLNLSKTLGNQSPCNSG